MCLWLFSFVFLKSDIFFLAKTAPRQRSLAVLNSLCFLQKKRRKNGHPVPHGGSTPVASPLKHNYRPFICTREFFGAPPPLVRGGGGEFTGRHFRVSYASFFILLPWTSIKLEYNPRTPLAISIVAVTINKRGMEKGRDGRGGGTRFSSF